MLALAAIVIFLMAQQASLVVGESEVEATMYACDAPLDVRWIVLCVWHDWNRLDIKPWREIGSVNISSSLAANGDGGDERIGIGCRGVGAR